MPQKAEEQKPRTDEQNKEDEDSSSIGILFSDKKKKTQ